ncbi:MAG: NusG domain II-containing protein [bacterium]
MHLIKRKDLVIISSLFALIFLTYLFNSFKSILGTTVIIQVSGKETIRLPLNRDKTIKVQGPLGESIIEIKNRKVRMLFSPCPDKLCMKQGWIDKTSQSIICVPNRIIIKIEGRATFDALTY